MQDNLKISTSARLRRILRSTAGYSSVPNKSAGWNIYQKLIKVQAEIIMQVGIFFKT